MFECEITVKGGGNSPSKDGPVTGPVKTFFRNYSKCYIAVKNHVLKCPKCCPEEALRRFLATRDTPKLGGFTSEGLVKMALQTERACKTLPEKDVDKALVDEYILKAGHVRSLMDNAARFDDAQLLQGIRMIWDQWAFLEQTGKQKVGATMMKANPSTVRSVSTQIWGLRDDHGPRAVRIYWMAKAIAQTWERFEPYPPEEELAKLATVAEVMTS
jgi:hypothetical protein